METLAVYRNYKYEIYILFLFGSNLRIFLDFGFKDNVFLSLSSQNSYAI